MINTVALMGRLTADPELKHTPNGVAVVPFCIAVNRKFKDQQADFINCVAWRQTAEFICKYFGKGQMIALEGSIQTRNYTDRDGNKRNATEVLVENASFCESKKNESNSRPSATAAPSARTAPSPGYSSGSSEDFEEITPDDDLPF